MREGKGRETYTSHGLDEPERDHDKGTLAAANTVVGFLVVVTEDHTGTGETLFFGCLEDLLERADEAGVVGWEEEDQRRDQNRCVQNFGTLEALREVAAVGVVSLIHDFVVKLVADLDPFVAVWTWKTGAFLAETDCSV